MDRDVPMNCGAAELWLSASMPGLGTAKERQANEASYDQFTAILFHMHFASVYRSGIGIEDVAAAVVRSGGLDVANDDHADDGLIPSVIGAGGTQAFCVGAGENFFDPSEQPGVFCKYFDDCRRLAGFIIDGFP